MSLANYRLDFVHGLSVFFIFVQFKISWFKDDEPLKASNYHSTFYDLNYGLAILRIKYVKKEDEGSYKCFASNIAGSDLSVAQLMVFEQPGIDETSYIDPNALKQLEHNRNDLPSNEMPDNDIFKKPFFVKVPKSMESREGAPVRFECIAFGRPDPELTWYFNGVPLKQDAGHKVRIHLYPKAFILKVWRVT
jgi:hypothetical protein